MAPNRRLEPSDALLVVDVQRDFCPGGALAVPEGDRVVDVLNRWSREAALSDALVVASRDWHPSGHVSFESRGGPWPEHCVQGTEGARFHPDLQLPPDAVLVSKGQHPDREACSAFEETGLVEVLKERGVRRIFVGGLTQEVCVRATVLDALRYGFETHVLVDATRPIDRLGGRKALEEMERSGAILEGGTRDR